MIKSLIEIFSAVISAGVLWLYHKTFLAEDLDFKWWVDIISISFMSVTFVLHYFLGFIDFPTYWWWNVYFMVGLDLVLAARYGI